MHTCIHTRMVVTWVDTYIYISVYMYTHKCICIHVSICSVALRYGSGTSSPHDSLPDQRSFSGYAFVWVAVAKFKLSCHVDTLLFCIHPYSGNLNSFAYPQPSCSAAGAYLLHVLKRRTHSSKSTKPKQLRPAASPGLRVQPTPARHKAQHPTFNYKHVFFVGSLEIYAGP